MRTTVGVTAAAEVVGGLALSDEHAVIATIKQATAKGAVNTDLGRRMLEF
jgi:hypothetical protein